MSCPEAGPILSVVQLADILSLLMGIGVGRQGLRLRAGMSALSCHRLTPKGPALDHGRFLRGA